MAKCEKLDNCPFFFDRMQNMPAMSDLLKTKYCLGENGLCARHIVYEAWGGKVPMDLFPAEVERAKDLIGKD